MDNQNSIQVDEPMSEAAATDQTIDSAVNEKLTNIKKQAAEALLPLIDELEGTPEHKFEILMQALQATPNPELLEKALQAAMQIDDKSARAEALVDILGEADYQQ